MAKKVEAAKEPKPRMRLADFYFKEKHEEGTRMPILLPSGEDSGEWLQVVGPDSDTATQASRAFTAALRALTSKYKDLHEAGEKAKDFTEYNLATADDLNSIRMDFAAAIVTGWSLDESFSEENLMTLMEQYKAIAGMVTAHHQKTADILAEK